MRILVVCIMLFFISCGHSSYIPQNGDIVLQDSFSPSSEAIKTASGSQFSHCGIIMIENGEKFVIEAYGPVGRTQFDEWVKRGKNRYTAMRLKNGDDVSKVISSLKSFIGKPYDPLYEWADDKIYCSELVYKSYLNGLGIELCSLRTLKEYDIKPVIDQVIERYGKVPENQLVIAPEDIFKSKELTIVFSN